MKKVASKRRSRVSRVAEDDMRSEYDFSKGRRNKYADRFAGGVTVVVLDADVAEAFPDAAAVNSALRSLAEIARRPRGKAKTKRRTA
jgi:hypothetical protein